MGGDASSGCSEGGFFMGDMVEISSSASTSSARGWKKEKEKELRRKARIYVVKSSKPLAFHQRLGSLAQGTKGVP